MITDQTSVFLAAFAQAAEVKRYLSCIHILGRFENFFEIAPTDTEKRIAHVLARLAD